MSRPVSSAAEEPLYAAILRIIGSGGMSALTIRRAAAEVNCSVGYMRHYYSSKSLMLACAHGILEKWLLDRVGHALRWHTRPAPRMSPAEVADLLAEILAPGNPPPGPSRHLWLLRAQISLHVEAHEDPVVARSLGGFLNYLHEICGLALHRVEPSDDPPRSDEQDALFALMVGLMTIAVPLADDQPERPRQPVGLCLDRERVAAILARQLHRATQPLDEAG